MRVSHSIVIRKKKLLLKYVAYGVEYVVNGLTASPQITRGKNQSIKQYIEKGYMRKSQEQEQPESGINRPQVPVIMRDKDSTETRIVIDTSARMDGLSLNGAMHNRPNLQRHLFDELLCFSRSSVAVVCGIGSVPADKPCHSFLWRGSIQNRPPESKYVGDTVAFILTKEQNSWSYTTNSLLY